MRMKRIVAALLLAALMLAMPAHALAAKKPKIRFPVKIGLMQEGASVTLKPKLSRIGSADLNWTSSNEDVLTVSKGTLQAVSAGKAIVTASGGGAKARCGVVVLPKEVTLAVGEKLSLPRGGVEKYAVADKSIATVSKKGVVTGRKAGETRVKVKYGRQSVMVLVAVAGTPAVTVEDGGVASLECASQTDQIVLVERTGGSKATLSVYEKKNGSWARLFDCPARIGKNGLGKTTAGDKRTPSGTYNLTTPFGIKPDPGAQMPYTQVTKYHYWCGASDSGYYNQLVDERVVDRKHTSADEYLIQYKGVYNYCMFIDYNASGEPHRGSCIFLHCNGSKKDTSGCIAIAEANMKKIICWARPGAKIVIREKP